MLNYSGISPTGREQAPVLKPHYSDDSDDEKLFGPPELSDFGAALLSEKRNQNAGGVFKKLDGQGSHSQRAGRLVTTTFDSSSGTFNQNTGQTYVCTQSAEPSQSTIFAQSKNNHQPSITTMETNVFNLNDSSDLEKSFRRIKNMQQTMREELTSRHAERRSKRFLKSSRIGMLGPAKRSATNIIAGDSDSSLMNLVSNRSDVDSGNLKNNDGHDYFSKGEKANKKDFSTFNDKLNESISRDHTFTELGVLNPVQYMKKHNLPSSELPNLSRIYFERQREENHHLAIQKHIASREALNNKAARSFSYTSSINNSFKRESSAPALNPRRKLSDTSISSTSKTALLKTRSSPLVESSLGKQAFLERNQEPVTTADPIISITPLPVHLSKQHNQPTYAYHNQNISDNTSKKREALANIDINRNDRGSILANKRLKLVENKRTDSPENKEVLIKENHGSARVRNPKRVEIIEPRKSQNQSKRNFIKVNEVEYEKIELLGRGGSSKVYKVKDNGNRIYALKRVVFDEFDDSSVDGFKGEIELLRKLENQNRVVKLIDHEMDHGVLFLIMECGDHDLSQILNQRAEMPLDIEFVRYHAREMLKCVKVVHDSGIVHSDLKPANFVLVKGILKIIDFGIANAVPDHTVNIYRETQIGTPNYMAPEALVAMNYTQHGDKNKQQNRWRVGKPSDIWSCGCIIYQMIYGRPPYGGFQGQNRLLAIMNPEVKIIFSEKTTNGQMVPRSALDLMKACLFRNPEKRWTVDEILESSFLKPVMVTPFFIRDLIKNAVKYGADQKEVSNEKIDELADDVLNRLEEFRL